MNSIVSDGQSLLDVCLQELGTIDAAFDLAAANGLTITDELTAGQVLIIPASVLAQPEVAAYFASRRLRINTANQLPPPEPDDDELNDWDDNDFEPTDFY